MCVYIQWGVFNGVATPREVFVLFCSVLYQHIAFFSLCCIDHLLTGVKIRAGGC